MLLEVERLAARRLVERLATLTFLQAVSRQCLKTARLQVPNYQPDPQLLSMLAPLRPGDHATSRGTEYQTLRADSNPSRR